MSTSQYGRPFLVLPGQTISEQQLVPLDRLAMAPKKSGPKPVAGDANSESVRDSSFDEAWLQRTLFRHPDALPVDDIDPAYRGLVPICEELPVGTGAADIFYATPEGRLAIVETKLWRNHTARREVVSQILEYASELVKLTYEDLNSIVSRKLARGGNTLFDLVSAQHPGTEEQRFIDNVSKTLRHGRFLLLIVGDGIRDGAQSLVDFIEEYGSLEFAFGLVEVGVYSAPDGARLFQPRVLAKTLIIKRTVVSFDRSVINMTTEDAPVEDDQPGHSAPALPDSKQLERQAFYQQFWTSFIPTLQLDDTTQPLPKPTRSENIYLPLPPSMAHGWISAYFSQSKRRVGVYMRFASNSAFGKFAYPKLVEERVEIDRELGPGVLWDDPSVPGGGVGVRLTYDDLSNPATIEQVERYFRETINAFVRTFRPRLSRLAKEFGA
jgi:hypothetical protein